jgi:uridylate kinase
MGASNMKRVLIKLSGEALRGNSSTSFSQEVMIDICNQIESLLSKKIQVSIVVGGGNIFRGKENISSLNRSQADRMGMLATVINGLALQDALESRSIGARVFSALPILGVCEVFDQQQAIQSLESGKVVICVAGTGNPYFTTDTAAVLRALELKCHGLMKATKVDGVYDCDPHQSKVAKRFDVLSYQEVMEKSLAIMDATAIALAAEHKLPIMVFSLLEKNCFERVLNNQIPHTIIS